MKSRILKAVKTVAALIAVTAVGITILYATDFSYFYCGLMVASWRKAANEKELEARLFAFYTKSRMMPAGSYMGRDHDLKPGQRMTRYLIFNKEPLDIVYNKDGAIAGFYESYE